MVQVFSTRDLGPTNKMGSPTRPREAAPKSSPHAHPALDRGRTAADRAVLTFLQRELLPDLERDHHLAAAKGVHRALRAGALTPLRSLSAVDKHELLGVLEARLGRSSRMGPSVIVKLIASLELTPSDTTFDHRRPVLPLR